MLPKFITLITLFEIILLNRCIGEKRHETPLWSWECVDNKCVPLPANLTEVWVPLETCNMMCATTPLWPFPTSASKFASSGVPVRAQTFQLDIVSSPSDAVSELMSEAFQLFLNDLRILEREARGHREWRSVQVRVAIDGDELPRLTIRTDESYQLSLKPKDGSKDLEINITAHSFYGARHGLETFSQLIWFDPYLRSLIALESAHVNDKPIFRYRGLMLDTARNYFPVGELLHLLDAMGWSKLNTFHWHCVDSQAFPLQLAGVPQLAEHGAYGPGAVYTPEDVRAIVHRARLRGVRVLLEVDVPAHVGRAWSWGPSHGLGPLVHCVDSDPWTGYCNEPPCGQLNPRNPHVYRLLERIYEEIVMLTGVDDLFHIGGDDISERCWLEHFNHTDVTQLWLEFTRNALNSLPKANDKLLKTVIFWSSRFNNRLHKVKDTTANIAIQVKETTWSKKSTETFSVVYSHSDAWDLNSGLGLWHEESGGAPFNAWQRVYEHRPWVSGGAAGGASGVGLILGGEGTLWSEQLGSGGLDARAWPRAAALAERLWSDRAEGATREVQARLDHYRSLLIARGVQAAPLWTMWCTHNPLTCG